VVTIGREEDKAVIGRGVRNRDSKCRDIRTPCYYKVQGSWGAGRQGKKGVPSDWDNLENWHWYPSERREM